MARKSSKPQTLNAFFGEKMKEAIEESIWFRTAPPRFQAQARIRLLGVEMRTFRGWGSKTERPALVAECEIDGEVERFSMLLDGDFRVQQIGGAA
jgi:hypothetical protein